MTTMIVGEGLVGEGLVGESETVASEQTLEWYQETGAPAIPLGDWRAKFEPGGGTSTEIAALTPGHIYLFRARAINSIGVRSAWSTQQSIKIADTPLVQTRGLAMGAATQLITTKIVSDSWTTAFTSTQIRTLGLTFYTNDTGGEVSIEFSLTSQRRVATPASATLLDVVCRLGVLEYSDYVNDPGAFFTVGPPDSGVNHIEDMGPSEFQVFNESITWEIVLANGHTVAASSLIVVLQGAYSGVVVDTANLTLRMTIVKR